MMLRSRQKRSGPGNALRQRAERYQVGLPSWQSSFGRGSLSDLGSIRTAVRELRKAHQAAAQGAQPGTPDAARRRIHLNV